MILPLLKRNLRGQWRLLVALISGVFALELLIVQVAAAFGPTMIQMFESLPPFFRGFVGAQLDELSLTSFVGFGFKHPATLAMGLALAVLTATLPASERETGLLDLLLARPVPRTSYLLAVLLCLVAGAIALALAGLGGAALGLAVVEVEDEPAWTRYVASAFGQGTLLLAFGGVTLLLATHAQRRGTAAARAVAVILVLFVVDAFGGLYAPLERFAWLSPFRYFQPIRSALSGPSWTDPLVLLAIFAISTALGFARFARRDL